MKKKKITFNKWNVYFLSIIDYFLLLRHFKEEVHLETFTLNALFRQLICAFSN